jgi:thiosulfate/3-mercaptopyruvate sulfurtransferase
MKNTIPPILQATELLQLSQFENLVLIDASNGKNTKANYDANHLDGALFVDLNSQLADIKENIAHGGRHPLPTLEQFATTLSSLGITPESHVVVYDDKNGANASARFWWMLKAVGHNKVQVLNGGFQEAEKVGYPVNSKIEIPKKVPVYKIENWQLPFTDIDEVEQFSQNQNCLVIDVRDKDRFNGQNETMDLVAGHILGAINIPFSENLNENGLFLSPAELKSKYEKVFDTIDSQNTIIHCGSGVTACHTLLAIAHSGLEMPKLYVGSWSEWSRNKS